MLVWTIDEWPQREQPDALLAELHAVRGELHAEATPGDPRMPLAGEIALARHRPAFEDGIVLTARDPAGMIRGYASCSWLCLPGWDHLLQTHIAVVPGARRQGLGRLLLDRAAAVAQRRGLRLVTGRTKDNVPVGAAFCGAMQAQQAMTSDENRLDLRGVDRALVDRWLADGPRRAPAYRLLFVAGPTPPELADEAAAVLNVMNTAPREDLDVGDIRFTPELLRQDDEAASAAGAQRRAYYAVEEKSGRFVGLTDVIVRPELPDRVWVGDTAVDPAHRGQGLGKWLKGAITRHILDDLPEVRWVITWNAGSNAPMLAINHELGFRAVAVYTTWQLPVEALRAAVLATGAGPRASSAALEQGRAD
ncbi:MAG TPA: GNAT family N-acetyltransferase [Streptosporangiaceae bacterium]|nr:GNAT family N-acetyltransferase [Streptosporangiaceae bacterium]